MKTELRRFSRAMGLSLTVVSLLACERPGDRLPPGYMDACYGGRSNMMRNWVLSDTRLQITVHGQELDWPKLAALVEEIGTEQRLQVFNTSTEIPGYIRMVQVSICDAAGLFLLLDKRKYDDATFNHDGDQIAIYLRTYHDKFNWRPIADALIKAMQSQWNGDIKIVYPPLIPMSEKELAGPDSLREQLKREKLVNDGH